MRKRRQYERIRLFYLSQIRGILSIERIPHWSGIPLSVERLVESEALHHETSTRRSL